MKYLFWIIVLLLVLLRIFFYFRSLPNYPDGTKIKISTRVLSEPVKYEAAQYLNLYGFKIYLPLYSEISYGDTVTIEGEISGDKLKNVKLISVEKPNSFLFSFRRKIIDFYSRSLPGDHAALISGVTLGSKENLTNDFWEKLKKSGTAHVVVASGMNVTLIAGFLMSVLIYYLPRRKAVLLTIAGIFIYALLSGFDAPIIRAAIMGTVSFSAMETGRISTSWRALFLSAFIMIIIKPVWITDYGFLLSFSATAGLLAFEKRIRKFLKRVPAMIREDLSTTLAAQIGVAPVFLFGFGGINLLSPVYNVLVLWTVVPMTVIGMVGGLLGLLLEPLGRMVLMTTYPLTSWFIFVTSI